MKINHISDNIKFLREFTGLTQGAFADLFGVSRDNIASYERGTEPKISFLTAIVNYFNIAFEDLIHIQLNKTFLDSKCVGILTVDNGKEKGKGPNVQNSLPIDTLNLDSKCVENAFVQNEGVNEGFFEGNPNVYKTPSIDTLNLDSKCVENVTLPKGDKKGDIPNVQKTPPIVDTTSDVTLIDIPITDISAAAGGGVQNRDQLEVSGHIQLPKSMLKTGTHLCINVDGRSMEPTLQHNSNVIIRLVERNNWSVIKTGAVCVLTDREGSSYIKRIENRLTLNGTLVLRSDNTDKRRYAPIDLSEGEIYNIWTVEWYLSSAIPDIHSGVIDRVDSLEGDVMEMKGMLKTLLKRQ